jgi:PAS domain-containing protein
LEVNQVSHTLIEKKTVDLSAPQIRDTYFASLLTSIEGPIYSLSIGTKEGYYYGARKNVEAVVELMHNDIQTGGKSWYYALNDDFSAGQRVVEAGLFDPRTRPWYQAAAERKAPVFSPVYKHFIMNDLTISAATPLYDKDGELQGVLGTHLLLTDLGSALADAVALFDGQAIIVEKETGLLIANSLGLDSHVVSSDGQLHRSHISELPTAAFALAFEEAVSQPATNLMQRREYERYQITTQSLSYPGIDWLVITAIPNSLLFSHVQETLVVTILLTLLAGSLAAMTYQVFIGHLLRQVDALLKVSEALAAGALTKRVNVTKDDEIGSISHSLNHVADAMQLLINNLEQQVEERTKALHQANRSLEENTLQLELLLNSTAEAIYGIDLQGKCTFCNRSTLQILGFHSIDEVLGRNMHQLIHHSKTDGTPLSIEECKIFPFHAPRSGHRI